MRLRNAAAIPQVKRRRCRHAHLDGFDLHASAAVRKNERPRLERLCRYLLRPPVAQERLSWSAGKVLLKLETPWRDGSTHVAFTPTQLLEKLAALVPRPLANQTLYHGVLAPNAQWRPRVVAYGRPHPDDQDVRAPKRPRTRGGRGNRPWAELMRRGLDLDVLDCPRCGGRLELVATLIEPRVVRRILEHLGLPADPITFAPARAPPVPTDDVEPGTHPRPAGLKLRGLPRSS